MGVMERKIILLSTLLAIAAVPALASVTPEQAVDAEYVMNQGYSQMMAEDLFIVKNRSTGKPIETLYEKDSNKLVRGWKAFWGYFDPAREEYDRIHHNIKPSPSFSDL